MFCLFAFNFTKAISNYLPLKNNTICSEWWKVKSNSFSSYISLSIQAFFSIFNCQVNKGKGNFVWKYLFNRLLRGYLKPLVQSLMKLWLFKTIEKFYISFKGIWIKNALNLSTTISKLKLYIHIIEIEE